LNGYSEMNADEREADRESRDTYDHDVDAAKADESHDSASYLAHWLDLVQS
jgi:hypothetical protein